ncbi:PD-(D/E)XK nuclease domain-containing protein [Candidatus Dependentiae bacterium]|nr:PD-(D/E)XK nuclease domain-containing protein [Candidatus Dependentiae bacterium]MBU4387614.1 PD-(D/E)XK nuclease domain-containing protein [Candidatus Dependentiae bacterium]MCG2756264.1 PD-(D/E)XK nuclease domain-containing protein [Candidatus Dependentiae bacterium]
MNYKKIFFLFLLCFSFMSNILSMGKREKPVGKRSQPIEIDLKEDFLARSFDKGLDKFCESLEQFVWDHFSYYDFSDSNDKILAKERSIIFFLLGFFSGLDERKYVISVENNNILIKKDGEIILGLIIKGTDNNVEDIEKLQSFCNIDMSLGYKQIAIVCSGKKIKCNNFGPILSNGIESNDFKLFESPEEVVAFFKNNNWFERFKEQISFELEKDFHTFILGLLANTKKISDLRSNNENANGRPDISIKTIEIQQFGLLKIQILFNKYIFELKIANNYNLKEKITEAKAQIIKRGYGTGSTSLGFARSTYVYPYALVLNIDDFKVHAFKFEKFKLD